MSKAPIILLVVVAATLFIVSVATGSRLSAGGGALVLLLGILYATWQSRRATPQETARGERGAKRLREELAEDEARRGTR